MLMKTKVYFENTNDPPGQTWFSNHEDDVQFYMPDNLYLAMGRPDALEIELVPAQR